MKKRFIIEPSQLKSNHWVCTDTANNLVCVFEFGNFNDSQKFSYIGEDAPDVTTIARATREMGNWLCEECYNLLFPTKSQEITMSTCVDAARKLTADAKSIKSWRLRRTDKLLQALEMPDGYLHATATEIREILTSVGHLPLPKADDIKRIWALHASAPDRRGKIRLSLAPITSTENQ